MTVLVILTSLWLVSSQAASLLFTVAMLVRGTQCCDQPPVCLITEVSPQSHHHKALPANPRAGSPAAPRPPRTSEPVCVPASGPGRPNGKAAAVTPPLVECGAALVFAAGVPV